MKWWRKPRFSYEPKSTKPKEESPVSENTKDQTEPFNPEDYKGQHFGWLSPFTSEEKDELRKAKSPDEFERITGRLLYLSEQRRLTQESEREALAAEKAKTHWATVMLYNNPVPHEAEAGKLDGFMDRMHHNHSYNEFKMVPLYMFNEGVKFVRLKDIASIHFTEEYMKARASANE